MTPQGQTRTGGIFVLLLLVSAGMASVPDGGDVVTRVRAFYAAHTGVVLVAQVVGLAAAVVFALFARALSASAPQRGSAGLRRWGYAVAVAAAVTVLPVLALCAVAAHASRRTVHGLAVAGDWTDVLLFAAIAGFCIAVARTSPRTGLRTLAAVVAALAAARAVLLGVGATRLELVAPLAFVVLVLTLSWLDPFRAHARRRDSRSSTRPTGPTPTSGGGT